MTTRMIRISRKLTLAASLTAIVLGLGTGIAFAAGDTDDNLPANTPFTSSSTNVTFSGTINGLPINVTCTVDSLKGTTPMAPTGLGPFNINNPVFSSCGSGLSVTTNSTNGSWQLTFLDSTATNEETATEGSGQTGDQIKITMPKAGAKFTDTFIPGCTITAAPTGPASVTGIYDDVNTLKLSNASVPVSASGCTSSSTTSVSGTYSTGTTHLTDSS